MKKKILLIPLAGLLAMSLVAAGCPAPPVEVPAEIAKLEKELAAAKTKVTGLEKEIAGLEAEVDELRAPVEVFEWRFQAHHPPGFLTTAVLFPDFIERIEKGSDGRLDITMYYGGELVKPLEVAPALKAGAIELADTGGLFWRGAVPVGWLDAPGWPAFVWRSSEEFYELFHYRGLDELMREGWLEEGVYMLNSHAVGRTHFWSSVPLYGVDDLKGFKVRFFGAMSDTMAAFGASPVFIPHEETYMAIAMGTLDGSGTAWWIYRDLKLYEVCPYFIGPAWQLPQGMVLFVALDAWKALPDDLKAIVDTVDRVLAFEYNQKVSTEREYMFAKSFPEWGVTYIEWGAEDVAKITEVSLELIDKVATEIGPKDPRVTKGIEIVKDFMREMGYID